MPGKGLHAAVKVSALGGACALLAGSIALRQAHPDVNQQVLSLEDMWKGIVTTSLLAGEGSHLPHK